MSKLQTKSVSSVYGIGPKKAMLFDKIGLHTLQDVLEYYPREYQDRTQILPIAQLKAGEKACICATVGTILQVQHIRQGMDISKLRVFDESGTLQITYFNHKYAAAALRQGHMYVFYGLIQQNGGKLQMISPEYERCGQTGEPKGEMVPIYPLTAGLTRKDFLRVTQAALLQMEEDMPDPLPDALRQKYGFADLSKALHQIHRPQTMQQVVQARNRFIYEEFFLLSCGLAKLKERRKDQIGLPYCNTELHDFWEKLPFPPTGAQKRAALDMVQDMQSGKPMNRLLQGDVGSGKTIVAAALCALALQNGYQAAVMAPTEILAAQHYQSFVDFFSEVSVLLLTGSMTAAQKREAKQKIAQGSAQIVIGTHALIQKDVIFANLGAVIVDEQHRFGVNQRAQLTAKGNIPHILVMSATPIPRTLALILYGDLDISILDELPPGRTPVETYAVGENMRERIYRFMEKQCLAGGQVYVVCPLVEMGEDTLKSAEEHAHTLQNRLPHRRIGLLHGRMKPMEKDFIMQQFAAGRMDILVATTVIEVGVNVPNANLMVVEDAHRFGLSQLHQLRGRVGRGKRQSYCIFFGADRGENAKSRLKLLCKTQDGFQIAQADLEQRGPGDFFGSRQHGLPPLHLADLAGNPKLLLQAQEDAKQLIEKDTKLQNQPILRERIQKMFSAAQHVDIFN